MGTDNWQKAKEIFGHAIELDPVTRESYIRCACGEDRALLAEVRSLLDRDSTGTIFDSPLSNDSFCSHCGARKEALHAVDDRCSSCLLPFALADSGTPDPVDIGPYRLLRVLGIGGMGVVYLAEQERPIRRRVALKLIKPGMDTEQVVMRFAAERQALALMEHPHIASVFDAGATEDGRPYFAMEYVPGVTITEYCDRHRVPTRGRLELFQQVCAAIQHAHQKGIIHRDLKPSNVLVMELDGQPVPKVIDFGIAKAMQRELTERSLFTEFGVLVGTPEYMSPEQADATGMDGDTRTDIYSLGILLYELLAGVVPFDSSTLRRAGFDEMRRIIREEQPQRPSAKLGSLGDEAMAVARCRQTTPAILKRELTGDLDWIALKALEKDRTRRYGSPGEMAMDLARHLSHEAISAGPSRVSYRAKKYIRRHRFAVAVALLLATLMSVFSVVEVVQLQRITHERDRADRIRDFMISIFRVPSPSQARGNQITAREILDKAAREIRSGLGNDPILQGELLDVMGGVYTDLGLDSEARALLAEGLKIRQRFLGPENPETLETTRKLAVAIRSAGDYPEAEKVSREALEVARRVRGPENPDTLQIMSLLASVLTERGRPSEAEPLARTAFNVDKRILGENNPQTIESGEHLGLSLWRQGRLSEAETIERGALNIERRIFGSDHPSTLKTMNNLGGILSDAGKCAEAEPLLRDVLTNRQRVLGNDHPDTPGSMNNLAKCVASEGNDPEAERLLLTAVQIQERITGLNNPDMGLYRYNLACMKARQGKLEEAMETLVDLVDRPIDAAVVAGGFDKDPDLKPLYNDPRFQTLVVRLSEKRGK